MFEHTSHCCQLTHSSLVLVPLKGRSSAQGGQGRLLSSKDLKRRGMKAASFHKTSIDALLHHKHAGATPYRAVLGDVSPNSPN